MTNDFTNFYASFLSAATQAGEIARAYRKNGLKIMQKSDGSPVSDADILAGDRIGDILSASYPKESIVSEEAYNADEPAPASFFLIDPIDGTRAYVNGENDYCINIAYIHQRRPVAGMIYIPETETVFFAAKGAGAFKRSLKTSTEKITLKTQNIDLAKPLHCVIGKSSPIAPTGVISGGSDNFIRNSIVSSAIKFCMIAEGNADLYHRRGATGEWDTAAGELIISEAGGEMLRLNGENIIYGKPHYLNDGFVACGDREYLLQTPLLKNAIKNI